jgi:hypothetical protein
VTVTNTGSVISSVAATSITSSSATISWLTSQTATSQVEYGATSTYGSFTPLDSALVSNHIQTMTGLAASTTYHYRVRSVSWSGLLSVSPDSVLVTGAPGSPGSTPPPSTCAGPDPFANTGGCPRV